MIEVQRSDEGLSVITLTRAPVNALTRELIDAITEAFGVEVAGGARAIVLAGAGTCFCAGIDTKVAAAASEQERAASVLAINAMVSVIYSTPVPVVASIAGHAYGGGLVLALACDARVAAEGEYRLALNEVAAGVPFPAGPLRVVTAELEPSVARDLCLTGRPVQPPEALALRLVDELVPAAQALERARALAGELAAHGVYAVVKEQLRRPVAEELARIVASGTDPLLARAPRTG
jgi:enoyl-CoA hydratase